MDQKVDKSNEWDLCTDESVQFTNAFITYNSLPQPLRLANDDIFFRFWHRSQKCALKNSKHRLLLFAQAKFHNPQMSSQWFKFGKTMCIQELLILYRQPFLLPRKPQTFENGM